MSFKGISGLPRLRVALFPGSTIYSEMTEGIPHVDVKECVSIEEGVIEIEKTDFHALPTVLQERQSKLVFGPGMVRPRAFHLSGTLI